MKSKRISTVKKICYVVYMITLVCAFYVNWQGKYFQMTFVACLTPFIVPIFMKLIKVRVPDEFYVFNIIFIYFASLWGSCLGGYSIPYYDKFTHFVSGIMICEVAYMLYKHFLRNEKRILIMCVFINTFNATVALLWEFYEYALFVFFQYDAIRNVTGVHDTMTDMLVAVIGGLLLTCYLAKYDQDEGEHFFVSLERKIHNLNKF